MKNDIKKIALIPSINAYYKNQIFTNNFENDGSEPFKFLKKKLSQKEISIDTIDLIDDYLKVDLLIIMRHEFNLNLIFNVISKNPFVKILYISTEEISVAPTQKKELLDFSLFDRILTWRDNEIDSKLFFKYNYMTPHRKYDKESNDTRNLACLINAYKINNFADPNNIYNERIKVIDFFNNDHTFSLYGHNWSRFPKPLNCYKGTIEDKILTYKSYDFGFIFENSNNEPGGISEKLWDSMAAGCIPIYYGAPNIGEYIPRDCYIDYRKFNNLSDLKNYLIKMSLKEKIARRDQIKKFMSSETYDQFTSKGFTKNILFHVNEIKNLKANKKNIINLKIKLIKKLFKHRIPLKTHKRFYFNLVFSKYI